MSHTISYSTADRADVLAFLGAGNGLTPEQLDDLGAIRRAAEAHQESLDRQGVDWGLSVPDALDHLVAGRADSDAECSGNAYHAALQHIIDRNASDPATLGSYSRPGSFFSLLDAELVKLGVPADMLPYDFLYGGLPADFPYLPGSIDGYPAIGHLPLAMAKPVADAYRAALDRVGPNFRSDVEDLVEMLEFEHEEWVYATETLDRFTQDTIFFSLT